MLKNNVEEAKDKLSVRKLVTLLKEIPKNLADDETKLRAVINAIPHVGGTIEKLLFANKDKEEIRQIIRFLEKLSEEINAIKEETIDKTFLDSFEFYCIFKKVLELVRFEFAEAKLKLFRNVLLNSITRPKPKTSIRYILNKLESLDVGHFEILKWYKDNNYITPQTIGADYDVIALHSVRKDYDLNILKDQMSEYYPSFKKDLDAVGFLDTAPAMDGHKRYFITQLGIELIEFVYRDNILNKNLSHQPFLSSLGKNLSQEK
ncbi:MAG: hypothetical protein Q8L34_01505 [Candidatus Woesearchaeota archaeon]|nr:hypothetical protein [Candidatus Woesearchaeota archaeon]